jgi:hypothetical protein
VFGIAKRMSGPRNTLLDSALIIGGAGISTLFVSTDGNGQNPLPVAAGMLLVVFVTGFISLVLAKFVRTAPLAIVASATITDLLFVLYLLCRLAFSRHVHEHADEEAFLVPVIFVVETAPTVLLSSIGFGRLANRSYRPAASGSDPLDRLGLFAENVVRRTPLQDGAADGSQPTGSGTDSTSGAAGSGR